ncbi:MAG: hypothetical protein RLZZ385_2490 [Pseudomonadota bacterium]|jgi:hypothetical protein
MRTMKTRSIRYLLALLMLGLTTLVHADVSGSWTFAVTLGQLGSGSATVVLTQEAEGKLTGSYAGQLANGPIAGTFTGNDFEFSFQSEALGGPISYKGQLKADGTVSGTVIVQGQEFGTFTGTRS